MKQLSTDSLVKRISLCLAFIALVPLMTRAQSAQHIEGDLLVQVTESVNMDHWLQRWNALQPVFFRIEKAERVSRPAAIWLLKFDPALVDENRLLEAVWADREVLIAQFNHLVELRATPSDALFEEQWQYNNTGQSGGTIDADIDAVEAWDVTTGGTTLTGDTIVVAVLDNGIDGDHPDFLQNRWFNHAEIPNNGMDDDDNGYEDDYLGWSTVSNNDNIEGGGHGTAVSGIVGADGDNELGVTGVNWHVKVMHIRNNFNSNEAKVLAAYSYPWEHRLAYNASGGAEGAFVVATNASWGVNGGSPEDSPLWCAFYDMMGEAGIISCGATANLDIDVDVEGDLPTTCPSDYLIAVTNTDHNDVKEMMAGYGATSIDLGAPGTGAYNIKNGGGYGGFAGTSGATPHVTGTAALLYSLDCPALSALTQSDPAAAALLIKEAIMEGVDPNASLQGITVTGGRLNVNNSVQYLLSLCDGCIPASSVQLSNVALTTATVNWNVNDSLQSVDLRWRAVGEAGWTLMTDVQSPFTISGLEACRDYEYQVQSNCLSEIIPFGNSRFFQTDGCCTAPEDVLTTVISGEEVTFEWDAVTAALSYTIRYRVSGTSDWTEDIAANNFYSLDGLESCTIYDFELRTNCDGEVTDWTSTGTFLTDACGPCLDLSYCMPMNVLSTEEEFIQQVEIGGFFTNSSDGSASGYTDYGQTLEAIDMEAGMSYPLLLTPGFTGANMFGQDWQIWMDLDHNGSFTSNEIVFETESSNMPINGFMTIPAGANLGVTRMRVLMQFSLVGIPCPFQNSFGEIEDYCVNISAPEVCPEPFDFSRLVIDANTVEISWTPVPLALDYEADYRSADGIEWLPLPVADNQVMISGLDSCAAYTLRVRTLCNGMESEDYGLYDFDTCPVGTDDLRANDKRWLVAPSPFRDQFEIRKLDLPLTGDIAIVLTDGLGRRLLHRDWPSGQQRMQIEANHLPAGLYNLALYRAGRLWSVKRVVKG